METGMTATHGTCEIPTPQALALGIALLAVGLVGCGDGLLGEDGIGSLTGHDDLQLPREPAWMVRWILEDGTVDGPIMEADPEEVFPSYSESEGTWYNYLNYVEVTTPAVSTPPPGAIRAGPHYSFALGIPLLLDDLDGDGDHIPPTEVEPGELWGVTPESAYLYIEGDLDRFVDEQPVVPEAWYDKEDEPLFLDDGLNHVWVNLDLLGSWDWVEEWFEEEWEDEGEEPEEGPEDLDLLAPDHPHVITSDHDEAFRVAVARIVDSSFHGGVQAFIGEAWFAWFRDPDWEDEE